jgi:hypothetical protein
MFCTRKSIAERKLDSIEKLDERIGGRKVVAIRKKAGA